MMTAMISDLPTLAVPDETEAWRAVEERDARYDGQFVYAVSSTGIYCRPTCPSRRPLRANVRFFTSPSDAASAGYRACMRCRPERAGTAGSDAIARARAYLEEHAGQPVSLAELARHVGLSAHHLQRTF